MSLEPDNPLREWLSDAQAHRDAGRWPEAIASLEKASLLAPRNAVIAKELGRLWRRMDQPEKARAYFEQAIQLEPANAIAWNGLGATLVDSKQFIRAEKVFRTALQHSPGLQMAENNLADVLRVIALQMHSAASHADWTVYEMYGQKILACHRARRKQGLPGLITPFNVLGFELSGLEHRDAAESAAEQFLLEKGLKVTRSPRLAADLSKRRIRIGYLSPDFRNNALAHLTHRLFGLHDRAQFEVFAYSFGPDDNSHYRHTMQHDAEHFFDIADEKPAATAHRIRADGIDILVDMIGFAANHRAEICARRPAPIQVFWLGYCASTGAPWIDYFISDSIASPSGSEDQFSERLRRMPDSYQMYSGEEFESIPTCRAAEGLPEEAMVYCSFNIADKIDPPIFTLWMDILKQVPRSVLWLMEAREHAPDRLKKWAERAGVDPVRLIFADFKAKREHLARLALADLFLDTTRFGAHTTASDALWAGVPVITCPGELFAQRVAASVCTAAGLSELVVDDMDNYRSRAIELGRAPEKITALKEKLRQQKPTAPLFDAQRFTRNLEQLYRQMIAERLSENEE